MTRWILITGGLLSGLAVLLGAFGAHALKHSLDAQALGWFDTSNRYLTTHALGLIACGLLPVCRHSARAAIAFVLGVLLFCGNLYLMTFTGITRLGIITPFGGLAFIAGWIFFCLSAEKIRPSH